LMFVIRHSAEESTMSTITLPYLDNLVSVPSVGECRAYVCQVQGC
jgi:hypothetical protein